MRVESAEGAFLAWGACSPKSRIRVRVWSFDEGQRIDAPFFRELLRKAIALREPLRIASDGVRLVHGESDGLPGLVVDRYGDILVAQFSSCGAERWKAVLADALLDRRSVACAGDHGELDRNAIGTHRPVSPER